MKLIFAGLMLALLSGCSSVVVKHQEDGVIRSYIVHTDGDNEIVINNGIVRVKGGGDEGT